MIKKKKKSIHNLPEQQFGGMDTDIILIIYSGMSFPRHCLKRRDIERLFLAT